MKSGEQLEFNFYSYIKSVEEEFLARYFEPGTPEIPLAEEFLYPIVPDLEEERGGVCFLLEGILYKNAA